ncbi:hypothetical protein ACN28S_41295 [Cystobacter fuscus]
MHERWAMGPLLRAGQWMDRMERGWTGALSGWKSAPAEKAPEEPKQAPSSQSQSTGVV